MCSEIDERTRENPESAMVHNDLANQLYQPQYQGLTPLEVAKVHDAHQKVMAQQYPGAWPWPVSVSKCATEHNAFLKGVADYDRRAKSEPKPEAQHFDTEAHRSFMRGLG